MFIQLYNIMSPYLFTPTCPKIMHEVKEGVLDVWTIPVFDIERKQTIRCIWSGEHNSYIQLHCNLNKLHTHPTKNFTSISWTKEPKYNVDITEFYMVECRIGGIPEACKQCKLATFIILTYNIIEHFYKIISSLQVHVVQMTIKSNTMPFSYYWEEQWSP